MLFAEGHEHEKRLGGAFSASVLVHVLAVVLGVVVANMPRDTTVYRPQPIPNYDLVFLAEPGPGGGGGGGGNKSPAPPQKKLELPKPEKTTPVVLQPKPEPPKPEPPKPEPVTTVPVQTIAAVLQPGTLEAAPTPGESRGSGTGPGSGTGTGTGSGSGQGSGVGSGWGGGFGQGPYRPGSGVETPRIVREVKPQYTADAMRAKIQGVVELEAVVLPDGTVGAVQVTRSLDRTFGLDQKAIEAVKQWRFIAGRRLGQPVPVLVTIELTFTLR
ncbi:MAG: energy transducer TonB [Vicinamibacterales bacterium]